MKLLYYYRRGKEGATVSIKKISTQQHTKKVIPFSRCWGLIVGAQFIIDPRRSDLQKQMRDYINDEK